MGNNDRNSVVKHVVYGLLTRYLRFLPQTYQGLVCMRTEVFGVKQKPGICAGMMILHNQRRSNVYINHITGNACGQYEVESCVLIGNLSGQDEPILSTQDCPLCSCARKNGHIKLVTFA